MEKVKVTINIAIMIEELRKQGVSTDEILSLLHKGDPKNFDEYGKGFPDWESFIGFYEKNQEHAVKAIEEGYCLTFLTKGSLQTLLRIKFDLQPESDYQVHEKYLDEIKMTTENFTLLKSLLAPNWVINKECFDQEKGVHVLRIELVQHTKQGV
ncbi:hypothetical protein J5Y03_07155 [Bacillus sp. RG28]|uniref:Uncharacterized protein n=1 Tax=Gottfriedia endophytica TaxID=2820819 RepID=A0A940SJ03_9BACI|nr:hypothetical protein [Gottfriedia endophytica]MBP0724966.1 hypothetical protein [Gottfriedia endophytica]